MCPPDLLDKAGGEKVEIDNNPPNPPHITGLIEGRANTEYEYNFVSSDIDGDDIYFYIDWGDGNSSWIGSYNSGRSIDISHIWIEEGYYDLRAKCKDIYGDESDWTTLELTMPKTKPFDKVPQIFIWLSERFPIFKPYFSYFL